MTEVDFIPLMILMFFGMLALFAIATILWKIDEKLGKLLKDKH